MLKKIRSTLAGLGLYFKTSLSHQPLSNGFKLLPVKSEY